MYYFIDENTIQKYNGEVLKRFVGKRLVKVISNPTDEHLKEFGYMELVRAEIPEYDAETQYIVSKFRVEEGQIIEEYKILDIPQEEVYQEEISGEEKSE